MRTLLLALVAVWILPLDSAAQVIRLQGPTDDPAARLLAEVLERNHYLILDRDTLLGPDTAIPGDVVIVESRVTLEGGIEGSVAVVGGDFFVRPRARVAGPIAVLGFGGAYVSGLAQVGERVQLDPRIALSVRRAPEGLTVVLQPPPGPAHVGLPGIYGFGLPTYDRVNGLSLSWGVAARAGGGDTAVVDLTAIARYRAARRTFDGTVLTIIRPAPRVLVTLSGGRATRTTETWIRGDLANTLATLAVASDARDYFESDEVSLTLARATPPPPIPGEGFVAPRITARLSRDRSLEAAAPWALFGPTDDWRPNPPVDEGVLASLVAGTTAGWQGRVSAFSGAAGAEWSPVGVGDFDFAQLSAAAQLWMRALWDHQIRVAGYLLLPIGSREAPLQRWSFVGGSGTLPTLPTAFMRGDHVLFINSQYVAPIPRLDFALLGPIALRLEHAVGAAWRTGDPRPPLEQNVGAGIQILIFNAMLFVNPAERPIRASASFGAQLPATLGLPIF